MWRRRIGCPDHTTRIGRNEYLAGMWQKSGSFAPSALTGARLSVHPSALSALAGPRSAEHTFVLCAHAGNPRATRPSGDVDEATPAHGRSGSTPKTAFFGEGLNPTITYPASLRGATSRESDGVMKELCRDLVSNTCRPLYDQLRNAVRDNQLAL
jgi:hypothetical protein